jgi:hemin uptake protein HemP
MPAMPPRLSTRSGAPHAPACSPGTPAPASDASAALPLQASANPGKTAQKPAGSALESADILRGEKTIAIHHNGATYHLQATRLGKLILTK